VEPNIFAAPDWRPLCFIQRVQRLGPFVDFTFVTAVSLVSGFG